MSSRLCSKLLSPTGPTGRSRASWPRSRRARAQDRQVAVVQGVAKKNFRWRRPRHTLKGRQIAAEIERVGLRLQLRTAQAEAGDIILLYGDESEALTHPYLARAWALRGADLRVPGARSGQESGDNRLTRSCHAPVECAYEPDQAQPRLHRSPRATRPPVRSSPRTGNKTGRCYVAGKGQVHVSKLTLKAIEARKHWLTVEWLPNTAPRTQRHRGCLARSQGAPSGPSDLR